MDESEEPLQVPSPLSVTVVLVRPLDRLGWTAFLVERRWIDPQERSDVAQVHCVLREDSAEYKIEAYDQLARPLKVRTQGREGTDFEMVRRWMSEIY